VRSDETEQVLVYDLGVAPDVSVVEITGEVTEVGESRQQSTGGR